MRKNDKYFWNKLIAIIISAIMVFSAVSVSFAAGKDTPEASSIPTLENFKTQESSFPDHNDVMDAPLPSEEPIEPEAQPTSDEEAGESVSPEIISISSVEELQKIGNDPAYPLDGTYSLLCEIDGAGAAFEPIGSQDNPFTGIFLGNNNTLSGLSITGSGYAGLFGVLDGTVKDLTIVKSTVSGDGYMGGLAGVIGESADMSNVFVFADIAGTSGRTGALGGVSNAPVGAFHNVLWSDDYGQKRAFGKESGNTDGPQTIKTAPEYLELKAGESAEIAADIETAQGFGLSFSHWEYDDSILRLEQADVAQITVTAVKAAGKTELIAVYIANTGHEVHFTTPVIISQQIEEQKKLEPVDPVFPTQMVSSLDGVFPMAMNAMPDKISPLADDADPPEITILMSYFENPNLRKEEIVSPSYKRLVYFWDTSGNLLSSGVKYQYSQLLLPNEINFDMVYPADELACFTVLMNDTGSGLAIKDFDGTQSPYFEYYLSRIPMTKEQLEAQTDGWWSVKQFDTGLGLNAAQGHWIVYVRVFDQAGNVAYASTQGYTQDNNGPMVTDVVTAAENETADGWAKSRTVTFRLEDPVLDDGTPGKGLDESRIYVHNPISSGGAPNLSGYGYKAQKNADGTFSVSTDFWPLDPKLNLTAFDFAINADFETTHSGPNFKQNELVEFGKVDSIAPDIQSVTQTPAEDVWSADKTISTSIKDTAQKMDWDFDMDDEGNMYTYPVPAADGQTDGSGVKDIFLSEDKNAQPGDEGNIKVKRDPVDASGAQNVSVKVDHNGTYYLIATDNVGNRTEKAISVTTIDNTLPVVMDVTHDPITEQERHLNRDSFTLKVSGISDEKEPGTPGSVEEIWYSIQNDVTTASKADAYVPAASVCSIPVTPPDGATTYYVWAKDAFGNYSEPVNTTIYKDTTGPTFGDPYTDPAGWTNQSQVTLVVPDINDAASGVKTVLYAEHPITGETDGQEMSLAGNMATVSVSPATEGIHTYYFRVVDKAGNLSVEKRVNVSIDRSAPTGSIKEGNNTWQSFLDTITFGQYHKDSTTFLIEAEEARPGGMDAVSGMESVGYYVRETDPAADTLHETKEQFIEASKGWKWEAYTPLTDISVPVDPNAKRVIYARLADKAGNVTFISSEGLVFDSTPPAVAQIKTTKQDDKWLVTFKLSDNVSGVDSATVKYAPVSDGSGEMLAPAYDAQTGQYSFLVSASGTWYVYAADRAGNVMNPVKIPDADKGSTDTDAGSNAAGGGTPKTGDTAVPIWVYLLAAIVAAGVIVFVVIYIRKKKTTGKTKGKK